MLTPRPEAPRPRSRFHRAAQAGILSFITALEAYNPDDTAHFRDIITISGFFGVYPEAIAHGLHHRRSPATVYGWARGNEPPPREVRKQTQFILLKNLRRIHGETPQKRRQPGRPKQKPQP